MKKGSIEGTNNGPLDSYSLLQRATLQDYVTWLSGFISKGGKPTHHYDYEFQRGGFLIARSHIVIPRSYGSEALHVIIPEGVEVILRGSMKCLGESDLALRRSRKPSYRSGIEELAGDQETQVIVPGVSHPDIGHNQLYFMREFRQIGGWVPTYPDLKDPALLGDLVIGLIHSSPKK